MTPSHVDRLASSKKMLIPARQEYSQRFIFSILQDDHVLATQREYQYWLYACTCLAMPSEVQVTIFVVEGVLCSIIFTPLLTLQRPSFLTTQSLPANPLSSTNSCPSFPSEGVGKQHPAGPILHMSRTWFPRRRQAERLDSLPSSFICTFGRRVYYTWSLFEERQRPTK